MRGPLLLGVALGVGVAAVSLRSRAELAQPGQPENKSILGLLDMTDITRALDLKEPDYAAQSAKRGIRNNNPLNIEHGDPWRGMAAEQLDPRFVTYIDPRYGFRAAAIIIGGAYARRGQTTLQQIISQWAPPKKNGKTENDTQAYIADVSSRTGIASFQVVTRKDYPKLFAAMTWHENGEQPYPLGLIEEGVLWA